MLENRFKVRIWSKKDKKMLFHDMIQDDFILNHLLKDLVFMQNTGLLDSKKEEIWEGDILKVPNEYERQDEGDNPWLIAKVEWLIPYGFFYLDSPIHDGLGEIVHHREEVEVIGNIYENPELLGKQKE